ncbi:hypothetical protein BCY91_08900 [Pelobium manganitolerans]|uniref:Uncharacterized protein n=2 Tax=Pelobium manganitolerans TaxID=1842495 RepID=A0A419S323_9SPHI|nr:hypothetical protein BCY91_08900 [Pelobium manganitolerans]
MSFILSLVFLLGSASFTLAGNAPAPATKEAKAAYSSAKSANEKKENSSIKTLDIKKPSDDQKPAKAKEKEQAKKPKNILNFDDKEDEATEEGGLSLFPLLKQGLQSLLKNYISSYCNFFFQ